MSDSVATRSSAARALAGLADAPDAIQAGPPAPPNAPPHVPTPRATHTGEPENKRHAPGDDLVERFASQLVLTPTPVLSIKRTTIDEATLVLLSNDFYDFVTAIIYPDAAANRIDWITKEEFEIVIKYALKMRLDVCARAAGPHFPSDRVGFSPTLRPPTFFSKIISNIGIVEVNKGADRYVPIPAVPTPDPASWARTLYTPVIAEKYERFVVVCEHKCACRFSPISSRPEGTAFWLLLSLDAGTLNPAAVRTDSVIIHAKFPELTPVDGLLAAIAAWNTPAAFDQHVLFRISDITDVARLRTACYHNL